jgi:hypothetical protein
MLFKVEWRGYGRGQDTWEPASSLSNLDAVFINDYIKRCPTDERESVHDAFFPNKRGRHARS